MKTPATKDDILYILERVEWSYGGKCPLCRSFRQEGHGPVACGLAMLKRQIEEAGISDEPTVEINIPTDYPPAPALSNEKEFVLCSECRFLKKESSMGMKVEKCYLGPQTTTKHTHVGDGCFSGEKKGE